MYCQKAIAPVIKQMFSEWAGLVTTLKDLERRIEILQIHQDLDDQNKSILAVSTIGGDIPSRHYYSSDYDQVDGCIQSQQKDNQVKIFLLELLIYLHIFAVF